jgi:hypothetical protein
MKVCTQTLQLTSLIGHADRVIRSKLTSFSYGMTS